MVTAPQLTAAIEALPVQPWDIRRTPMEYSPCGREQVEVASLPGMGYRARDGRQPGAAIPCVCVVGATGRRCRTSDRGKVRHPRGFNSDETSPAHLRNAHHDPESGSCSHRSGA